MRKKFTSFESLNKYSFKKGSVTMKKTICTVVAVATMSLFSFSGCSNSPENTDTETVSSSEADSNFESSIYNEENSSTMNTTDLSKDTSSTIDNQTSSEDILTSTSNVTSSENNSSTEETTTAPTNNKNNNTSNNNSNNNNNSTTNNSTTNKVSGSVVGDKNSDKLVISYGNNTSSEATKLAQAVIDKIITKGMSDFDKAKAIHDYMVINIDYDYDDYLANTIPNESYTVIGALKNKYAVCAGYAKTFQLLCQLAGLECTYVTGIANGSHAWNQVKIDGQWYNVDVTWDDPVDINKKFDDHKYNRYSYFLISDELMYKDHKPSGTVQTCSSSLNTKAYKVGAPWLASTHPQVNDLTTLSALAKKAVESNSTSISITWDTSWISMQDMKNEVSGALMEHALINFNLSRCTYFTIPNTTIYSCTFTFNVPNNTYIPMETLSTIDDIKKFIEYIVYDSPTQATVSMANELINDDIFYQVAVWAFEEHDVKIGFSETSQKVTGNSKSMHIYAFENTYHGSHHANEAYDAKSTTDILNILSEHHTEPSSFRVIYRYGDEIGRLSDSEVKEYVKNNLAPTWASKYCFKNYTISTDDFVCVMVITFSCSNHNYSNTTWEYEKEPTCIATGIKILKCSDCGNIIQRRDADATGVHDTYWVQDTDITKHLACKHYSYTGPVLQQYGQVWGYFDDNAATELFNSVNKKRETEKYIHRDYMGNFISSETPPQLTWDSNLATNLRTLAVCYATGDITGEYIEIPEYISSISMNKPCTYIPTDSIFYRFRDIDYLRSIYLTKAGTVCFTYDSDGTGLNLHQFWCIYFGE